MHSTQTDAQPVKSVRSVLVAISHLLGCSALLRCHWLSSARVAHCSSTHVVGLSTSQSVKSGAAPRIESVCLNSGRPQRSTSSSVFDGRSYERENTIVRLAHCMYTANIHAGGNVSQFIEVATDFEHAGRL